MTWTSVLQATCEKCGGTGKVNEQPAPPAPQVAPAMLPECPVCKGKPLGTSRVTLGKLRELLAQAED